MTRRAVLVAICLGFVGCLADVPGNCVGPDRAMARDVGVPNLDALFARLKRCWRSPALPRGNPGMEITVQFTFKRDGGLLGHPRITYETRGATDEDRIIYRTAVMQALQRCVPVPFTRDMGSAIAGRPMTIRFDDRRTPRKPKEKRAWLTTTIL